MMQENFNISTTTHTLFKLSYSKGSDCEALCLQVCDTVWSDRVLNKYAATITLDRKLTQLTESRPNSPYLRVTTMISFTLNAIYGTRYEH